MQVFPGFSIEPGLDEPIVSNWRKPQSSPLARQVKMGKHTRPGYQQKMYGRTLSWKWSTLMMAAGCCFSGLLTGCTGMNQAAVGGGDPLVGGAPVKVAGANPAAGSTTAAAAPDATASTPPIPIPISSTSPAALASSTPRTQIGGNDLRIASPRTSPNRDGWNTQPALAADTNPNPTIYANATMPPAATASITPLRAQDSTPPRAEPLPMVSPVSLPIGPKQEPTLDQLYAQLNARGMLFQKLDSNTDNTEWTFTCIVPRKSDPNVRRTYTGRASSSVGAVRVVLDQIDKDN